MDSEGLLKMPGVPAGACICKLRKVALRRASFLTLLWGVGSSNATHHGYGESPALGSKGCLPVPLPVSPDPYPVPGMVLISWPDVFVLEIGPWEPKAGNRLVQSRAAVSAGTKAMGPANSTTPSLVLFPGI